MAFAIHGDSGDKDIGGWVMSLVGWLIGILLAPVFITIGLGVLVISGLFDEVDWDE